MYSTKEKTKWQTALFLKGPYQERQKSSLSRHSGKQFVGAAPVKAGNNAMKGVLFSGPLISHEKYNAGPRYNLIYPPSKRKNAFGSRECPRRDEFLDCKRESQYKAMLKTEFRMEVKKNARGATLESQIDALEARVRKIEADNPGLSRERDDGDFVGQVPTVLYNIGRTKNGTTEGTFKDRRDRFYTPNQCAAKGKRAKHVQDMEVSSSEIGRSTLKKQSLQILMSQLKVPGKPPRTSHHDGTFAGSVDDIFTFQE